MLSDAFVKLEQKGIIYGGRRPLTDVALVSSPNRRQAMRNYIDKYAHVARYELDWIFRGHPGRLLYGVLVQHDTCPFRYAAKENGTIYLNWHGYNGMRATIKYYPLDRYGGWKLPYYKLEVSLHTPYFRSRGIHMQDLKTHPDIVQRIQQDLTRYLKSALAREPVALSWLQHVLGISRRSAVIPSLLSPELTLTRRGGT